MQTIKKILQTKTVTPTTLTRTALPTKIITITTTKTVTEQRESQKLFSHPVRHVKNQTTPQRKATLEPMQPTDRLPGAEDRKNRIKSHSESIKTTLMKLLKLQPKI